MARDRLLLHSILTAIVDNVYFQKPPSTGMVYPCIVYSRETAEEKYADNIQYNRMLRYQVTVIDRNPDSDIPNQVAALPLCSHDRFYVADNLNHDVFTLFF
jgi:hypothetical protein